MNRDILAGKWKQLKGEVRAQWGELTDDDMDRVAGNADKLAGVLQERYGWSKDDAAHNLADFLDNAAKRLDKPRDTREYHHSSHA